MALTTYQVGASADDAHEDQSGNNFSRILSHVLLIADDGGLATRYDGGFRFDNVAIAQGASILRAWFQVQPLADQPNDMNVDIQAEDADAAVDFATTERLDTRTRTTASVTWAEDDLTEMIFSVSPNIASVVEEVLARGGWSSGNALVLLVDGRSDSDKDCWAYSYDGDSGRAAQLSIKTGTAAAPVLPLRNVHQQRNVRFPAFL
jgi:hypothetical protein